MTATATFETIDPGLLRALPNPADTGYEISIHIPECTFLGVKNQPDFAVIDVEYVPDMKIIELKSLKEYIGRLRTVVVSYERLINILYDHLDRVYEPARMEVTMMCTPRGGISSRLTRRSP